MLNAEQIKKLKKLGFREIGVYLGSPKQQWNKIYGISVFRNISINVYDNATLLAQNIEEYKDAQHDLEELAKVGIK